MTRTERAGKAYEPGRGEELIQLSRSEIHSLALVRTRALARLAQICSLDDMRFLALVVDLIDAIFDEPASLTYEVSVSRETPWDERDTYDPSA